jgi:exopolysaccharide production protein ExoZ
MTKKLDGIQVLRGIAALLVLFHHTAGEITGELHGTTFGSHYGLLGSLGVSIFFVISGFIMCYTSRDDFGSVNSGMMFFWRRIIRIVPLYWLCTLLIVVMQASGIFFRSEPTFTATAILKSLFFVPLPWPDEWPLLNQGWSLDYEMFFYLIFAFWICVAPPRAGLIAVMATIVACFALGTGVEFASVKPDANSAINIFVARFLADPKLLLFVVGIAIALIVPPGSQSWRFPKLALLIGDTSYSLYLTHTFVLMGFGWFWKVSKMGETVPQLVWALILIVASVAFGMLVFFAVERPLTRFLQTRLSPRRRVAIAA